MDSPYMGLPVDRWLCITQEIVDRHPLSTEEIVDAVWLSRTYGDK
jgi:hypothetical protein